MIGLINANLLSLQQAIGIMLGQEIGTTITGQLISFQIRGLNLVFLIAGFYLLSFAKNRKLQLLGLPLFGFGVVFVGINMMSKAGTIVSQTPFFQQSLLMMSQHIFLGVLVGAVFTAAIQSSTAMTGMVIAMGSSNSIKGYARQGKARSTRCGAAILFSYRYVLLPSRRKRKQAPIGHKVPHEEPTRYNTAW